MRIAEESDSELLMEMRDLLKKLVTVFVDEPREDARNIVEIRKKYLQACETGL
jgi:hypothetical protein